MRNWLKVREVNVVSVARWWACTKTLPRSTVLAQLCWNFVKVTTWGLSRISQTWVTGIPSLAAISSWCIVSDRMRFWKSAGKAHSFQARSFQNHRIELKFCTHVYKLCTMICTKFGVNQTRNKTRGLRSWRGQPNIRQLYLSIDLIHWPICWPI